MTAARFGTADVWMLVTILVLRAQERAILGRNRALQ